MKIALISCGKKKIETPSPVDAQDLYVGGYFKACLKYCKNRYDKVFILSAKYGLLELDTKVLSYDKTLKTMSKFDQLNWAKDVKAGLSKAISKDDEIYIHTGKNYYKWLIKILPNKCYIPFEGLSIGKLLQQYTKNNKNENVQD